MNLFRSEEHARDYRRRIHRLRGIYLDTEQVRRVTRITQSILFGFEL